MITSTTRGRLLASTIFAGVAMVGLPAALIVTTSLAPTSALAQDYSAGTLSGEVIDSDGQPVAGARVVVRSLGQGFSREYTTGEDGAFRAALIPLGGYSVTVVSPGYQDFADQSVRVGLGGESAYSFTLLRDLSLIHI